MTSDLKISYAIPFKDEDTVLALIERLRHYIVGVAVSPLVDYEIVLLWDSSGSLELYNKVEPIARLNSLVTLHSGTFSNDFSEWKNLLNAYCSGDWIVQLDADEMAPLEVLTQYTKAIIAMQESDIECMLIPRWNIVDGLTEEDCKRWGWQWQGEAGINFPDYQYRIYRSSMKWRNKVHEIIDATSYAKFPPLKKFSILHIKSVERQRKQNDFYSSI